MASLSAMPSLFFFDTNVFISALKSKRGASYKLLFEVSREKYEQYVSVPLIFAYESTAKRESMHSGLSPGQIDVIIDMICSLSKHCEIFFLWRPFLKDPNDDHVLELAMQSQCGFIITYNKKDFQNVDQYGIRVIDPKEFLTLLGEI